MLLFLNVIYVLIAIAMVALILMQRGAGAQAGSGFGGGASATVFGARGSSNFLSKATKWLAIAFFAISLFMAWQASRGAAGGAAPASQDAGLAAEIANTASKPAPAPATGTTVPSVPAQTVPAAPASTVPSAPASTAPQAPAASGTTVPAAPAPQQAPPQQQPASGG
ncbi:preprotein translocase subunit SecG [Lysobacter sp. 5GHs7-4]|uniref:preprotein translocase subunit SecG n=1 Tax=Lysobacter sp. 5GHs7-4 TaxID=2904253 RepID=UPI001E4F7364|nr:preprotein translocase subunit SecG [Lysobacter sp. 5GHs7-4]UHQ21706.1 preprotein translocase subunit SecG [Lysobacter sp. 5GHs7-4]